MGQGAVRWDALVGWGRGVSDCVGLGAWCGSDGMEVTL